jgi:hypothetical protein
MSYYVDTMTKRLLNQNFTIHFKDILIVLLKDDTVFNYITDLIMSFRITLYRKNIFIRAVFTLNKSENI